MDLFPTAAILLAFVISMYPSTCVTFDSSPQDSLIFVSDRNTTNITLIWTFTVESGKRFLLLELRRFDESKNVRLYGYSTVNPNFVDMNSSFYRASRVSKDGPSSGSFNFTFKDIKKQISNDDGSPYDPNSVNYKYKVKITLVDAQSNFFPKESSAVDVFVFASPTGPIALHVDNTTSKVNSTVNITCTATTGNPPNTTLTFYRNNQKFTEVKNYPKAEATVTIYLDKPGIETFTCTAANLVGSSKNSSLLNVEVTAPPMRPVLQADNTTFCHLNATVNVTCVATAGYPRNTTVIFYRNNVKFREVKNDAEARATVTVNLDKLGVQTFTCQASNLVGSSKNSSFLNIAVKDPPAITQCDNQTSTEGDALSWTCDASGSQPLKASWVKGKENTIVSSTKTYNISSVSKSHAGMYRVTVSNEDECPTASRTVYLTVQYKPENLSVVRAQGGVLYVSKGQPTNVTCNAMGNPKPDYVWMFKGKKLHSPINSTIVIRNATLDDAGMYTCTAINSIGRENFNVTLQVNYIADANCEVKIHPVKDGDNVTLNCSAIGIPAVNYTWDVSNKVYHRQTTTFKATKSLNGTTVTCTAGNSFGKRTCSQTLVVYYLEGCKNITLGNKQCPTVSRKGYPEPELNCSLNGNFSVSQPEKDYRLCKPESNGSCTISNEAGKCHFGYEVQNQTKEPFDFRGTFRCTNRAYREEYGNENSQGFKKLKDELEQLLKLVYESFKIVTGIFVTAFHEGSVIVDFNLTLVANVNDPLSPLKDAVEKGGGNLSGFAIDPKSIKAGTTPTPTTPIPTTTKKPITTPSRISEEAIIAIAVVVPIVVILIIVLVWYFCCKKKEKRGEENISLEEGSPYRQVNGEENPGLSESQTSYARSGPKSDHNGQTTNNNPDTSDATATYAAVDMSKKKKKKQEGEVLYADLGSMRPGNNKGTELQPMSSSGNIPDKRESDYASIDFFKTQKQGEVKEYECLGTFTCTDRKYTKALDNEMTDSFKKLRDEVNTTVKSAYKDDTNFVLVEAEHFKWHPHGTIVIFKLILKEKVADPFLPLKEALEKNGGVVGAMKIIPQSVKEHEEEQNATGEQKKAQKQDEANAAAKHNVGFLGGKETESSNQDNSSPESQADMSASRDNTTMTTVSL